MLVNPGLFDLHPLLSPLRRKLDVTSVYGTLFLADDPATRSEHHAKAAMAVGGAAKEFASCHSRASSRPASFGR